jgi:hypothetical protein
LKKLIILFAAFLIFALSACGAPAVAVRSAEAQSVAPQLSASATITAESIKAAEPPPVETAELGSKENPVPLGKPLVSSIDGFCEFNISVTEVVRGENAKKLVLSWDDSNFDEAEENSDMEYVAIKISAKNTKDLSEGTSKFPLLPKAFNLTDKDNYITTDGLIEYEGKSVLLLLLAEGQSGDGWIAFLVAKDNADPKLVCMENYWFLLK